MYWLLVTCCCGSDRVPGVELSPCFSIFLARTTFVLESLPEAKVLARMLFMRILSLTVVIIDITAYLIKDCDQRLMKTYKHKVR